MRPAADFVVVAWETTRRCGMRCAHCRGSARDEIYDGELSTQEGLRLIDGIAARGPGMIILTGGEPMARQDIYELAAHATRKGLRVVMAPCGSLVTPDAVQQMKDSGVAAISISLDGTDAATHDKFRGVEGAFQTALTAIAHARDGKLPFQINMTLARHNRAQLPAMLDLARNLGAAILDVFLLVPTGRASLLREQELSAEQYEDALTWIRDHADGTPKIKVTCAPHYARVAAGTDLPARPCMAGRGFVFVSHRGVLQGCGFLDLPCGDLRQNDFDFAALYKNAPVFQELRAVDNYQGRCGVCEYRHACGGCRARALAHSGSYLDEEPLCAYVPKRKADA